jgi:hypothetical protein
MQDRQFATITWCDILSNLQYHPRLEPDLKGLQTHDSSILPVILCNLKIIFMRFQSKLALAVVSDYSEIVC